MPNDRDAREAEARYLILTYLPYLDMSVQHRLKVGDVVIYRGSMLEQRGRKFVIRSAEPLGLRLLRIDGKLSLKHVRRASVRPTGQRLELCTACQHVRAHAYGETGLCAVGWCECRQHGTPVAESGQRAMSPAAEHLLLAILGTVRLVRRNLDQAVSEEGNGELAAKGQEMLLRAQAAVELEALVNLARTYIRDCPELGITQRLLTAALTGNPDQLYA